jgi:hypothetical protein
LAEARSKFDVDLVSDSDSSVCEEDLLEIALQKSMDPTEQIDLDNRVGKILCIQKRTIHYNEVNLKCGKG